MPISGVVLTLSDVPRVREGALDALRADPRITLGEPAGLRWPVVVDTPDGSGHQQALDELERAPGIVFVELAFADFSDVESIDHTPRRRRARAPEV
ncbi:MAG: hypothetical protein ACOCXM_09795 [Myxococcota bacterium]